MAMGVARGTSFGLKVELKPMVWCGGTKKKGGKNFSAPA